MSSAAAAGNRAFGSTAGCRSRSPTSSTTDVLLLVGVEPGRDHAAAAAAPRPAARARRPADRRRPAAHRRPPSAPTCTCSRCPAPTWRSRSGCCTSLVAEGASTRSTSPRAPPASTTVRRGGRRAGGPSGSSGSPACRSPTCAALAELLGRRRARRWCSPRAAPSSTPRAPTRCSAWINLALALGLPGRAGLRLRLPHRPGQRPGRPRARAEGRPAARLPDDRRPGGPRARRRRSGACDPDDAARPGALGVRAARRARHRRTAPRALLVFGTNLVVSAPAPRTSTDRLRGARPAGRRRLRAVGDRRARRRGAAVTQWAEEDGTMTNLEGRVILRAAGRRRRRAGVRTDLEVIAGLADRLGVAGARSPTDPRGGLRRAAPRLAPAGRPTTPASPTTGSTPSDGVFWPCPDAGPPGHAAAVPRRASRTPDGRARFVAVEHRRPGRAGRRRVPAVPHHRPGAGALPVRRPDPPGRASCPAAPEPFVELHPTSPTGSASRDGDAGAWSPPGAASSRRRPGSVDDDPAGHGLRAVPLAVRRPTGSPTTRSTRSAGCRSSRSAPSRGGAA